MPTPVARLSYRLLHTAALTPARLDGIRSLLELVFADRFADTDWPHTLGGMHVLAQHEDALIGHGAVIQRRLVTGGRALRAGYVEGLAVHPDWRRQGVAGRVMARLEPIIRRAYDLGALAASAQALRLYEGRGWVRWRGPLSTLAPTGVLPTPDEVVHVLQGHVALDLDAELMCDWRNGDVW